MAHQHPPGVQMYEAIWLSDGERVSFFYMSAANEAAVLAEAKLFLKEHPDFRRANPHLALSIRRLSDAQELRGQRSARKTSAFSSSSVAVRERSRSKHRAARCNGSRTPRA